MEDDDDVKKGPGLGFIIGHQTSIFRLIFLKTNKYYTSTWNFCLVVFLINTVVNPCNCKLFSSNNQIIDNIRDRQLNLTFMIVFTVSSLARGKLYNFEIFWSGIKKVTQKELAFRNDCTEFVQFMFLHYGFLVGRNWHISLLDHLAYDQITQLNAETKNKVSNHYIFRI